MRVPAGEERSGDKNVKFRGEFAADRAVNAAHDGAGARDKRRDDFTGSA
jgi:hypothetical protein